MYESVSRGDNAAELVDAVVGVLAGQHAGLVTDVDGTISPIVERPAEAHVLPSARLALVGLRDVLNVVAVVSGRSAADVRAMVGVDGLTYVGNHGLERWTACGPQVIAEARPWIPRVAAVLDEIQTALLASGLAPGRGILLENKGATASLHYRLTADPEQARRALLDILAHSTLTAGLEVEEGRMVINVLPPLGVTKGSAVTRLVDEHALEHLVYIGDDVTDVHAFQAINVLRGAGRLRALCIGVVGDETPSSVRQLADVSVPSAQAVADLLCQALEGLTSGVAVIRPAQDEC